MEILNNTIIKLIVRQGANTDRKRILLNSGEPAFTTDTHRFYVGTGILSGGTVVGNKFQGTSADVTGFTSAVNGDDAYDSDKHKLYKVINDTDVTQLSNWEYVGGVYSSGDNYITISSDNKISLDALSANALSNDLVKGPIILDSGRITLSATIPFQSVSTKTITISDGLKATINGSSVTGTAVNLLSSNLIVSTKQLYARYNGVTQTLTNSQNISSVTWLSAGHYIFNFDSVLPNTYYIPTAQIIGISNLGYHPRVISMATTSCHVVVLSANGSKADVDLSLLINY
jgi:hypothetical protein